MAELELLTGSRRYIPMVVSRRSEEDFTIEKFEYQVLDRGKNIIDQGDDSDQYGIINGHELYYYLDSTRIDGEGNLLFEVGKTYTICYSADIMGLPKTVKQSRDVKITRC